MQNRAVIIKNAESKSRIITLLGVIFIKDLALGNSMLEVNIRPNNETDYLY